MTILSLRRAFTGLRLPSSHGSFFAPMLGILLLGLVQSASARITRVTITSVQSPTFEGASFGNVGQYEKLVGRAFGEVDPNDPQRGDYRYRSRAA